MKALLKILSGLALLNASLWIGAWMQEVLHNSYYDQPAMTSACIFGIIGIALIMWGIIEACEP